jgi:hypothetical protein
VDRRGRELERRWQQSGAWEDMEAFMAYLRRADPREWLRAEVLHAAKAAAVNGVRFFGLNVDQICRRRRIWHGTASVFREAAETPPEAQALIDRVNAALEANGLLGLQALRYQARVSTPEWFPMVGNRVIGEFVVVGKGPHRGRVDRITLRRNHRLGLGPGHVAYRPGGSRYGEPLGAALDPGRDFAFVTNLQVINLPRGVFSDDELPIFLD